MRRISASDYFILKRDDLKVTKIIFFRKIPSGGLLFTVIYSVRLIGDCIDLPLNQTQ